MSLLGPYLVACFLLVIAGSAKGARPLPTVGSLGRLFPKVPEDLLRVTVRVFAISEAALGVAAAAFPHPPLAGAVAASYTAFCGFVLYVRARDGVSADCGCLPVPEAASTATRAHIVVDMALAASAAAVGVAGPGGSIVSLMSRQALDGVPLLGACVVASWLVVLTLVALPRLSRARELSELGAD